MGKLAGHGFRGKRVHELEQGTDVPPRVVLRRHDDAGVSLSRRDPLGVQAGKSRVSYVRIA